MSPKPKRKRSANRRRVIVLVALFTFLLGIVFGGGLVFSIVDRQVRVPMTTEIAELVASHTPTALPTFTPTATLDPEATPMCFMNWAYDDVPAEHVATLHTILQSAGYSDYDLMTSAYGEDYICQSGDTIVSSEFLLMDMTPTITLNVDSDTLNDPSALGAHIRTIVTAIAGDETLPTVRQVEIEFLDPSDARFWSYDLRQVMSRIADDISDAGLYALGFQE